MTVLFNLPAAWGQVGRQGGSAQPSGLGRVIVGVQGGHRPAAAASIHAHGGRILSYYGPGDFYVVQMPSGAPAWVASLRGSLGVRYAEPDFPVFAADTTPNDPLWGSQWGPQSIHAPEAWNTSTGSPDVVVGVIDSGVDYTHEDLASEMWTNPGEIPGDGIDNDGNGYVDDVHGIDCKNDDSDPMDDFYHGTHVAGIIGAAGNNGVGVTGTSWHVRIMALKFLGSTGSGSVTDAIECLDYAIAQGAAITNNSWGGVPYSQALYDAINRARTAGQVFVAAAGNAGSNIDVASFFYPASFSLDNIVSVAATDMTDALASFSNFGPMSVDLAAPGVGILSTSPGNGYANHDGTSMAAAFVSGAASLALAAYPDLSSSQIIDRIRGSVDGVPALAGKVATGGRLNAARAVEADSIAPAAPNLSASSITRNSVRISWQAPAEDGSSGGRVSSYVLRYAASGTSAWAVTEAPAPATPATAQSATVSGLRPGTRYDFSLIAKDNVGNTSEGLVSANTGPGTELFFDDGSDPTQWTTSPPWALTTELPHSPTSSWSDSPYGTYANGRDVSIVSRSFSLVGVSKPSLAFWQRYQLQQGRDFGYVYVSIDGGATWTQLAKYTGASDYRAATISLASYVGSPNVALRFRFKADATITNDGWYVDDVLVSADDTTPPSSPQGLVAVAGDSRVTLDWADNLDPDLVSYRVYRTTDPADASTRTWTSIGSTTQSTYANLGLSNSMTYYFRVTAVDIAGNESASSDEVSATPADTTPPTAPQGLTATPQSLRVELDWADSSEPDFASFNVYRTLDPPSNPARSWETIAVVTSSNVTDTQVANGATYFYRVTASDVTGNESGFSDEVAASPSPTIKTNPASKTTISKGTSQGDPVGNLADSDDQYFRVASVLSGRKQALDWYGSATVDPVGATKLTITYEGSWSAPVTQRFWVRDFSSATWEPIFLGQASTSDATFTWVTTNPAAYVSAQGEARFRVGVNANVPVTCRADLLRFTVQY